MEWSIEDKQVILGIDPGTTVMGFGVIAIEQSNIQFLAAGVVKLGHLSNHHEKLKAIYERTLGLLEQYRPQCVAIEAPFYGKNVQSMLKLGRAQGTAIAAVISKGLPVTEYAPKKIKQSVTGNGNASKEQVAAMLEHILRKPIETRFLDATDGLAAAVCHHYQLTGLAASQGKSGKSWEQFLKENPGRIIGGSH